MLQQLLNVKAPIDGVYRFKYGEALWCSTASILFQVVCKHLFDRLCNLAIFHCLHATAKIVANGRNETMLAHSTTSVAYIRSLTAKLPIFL